MLEWATSAAVPSAKSVTFLAQITDAEFVGFTGYFTSVVLYKKAM